MTYRLPDHAPVLAIEPVTDATRAEHGQVAAAATVALVQTFRGATTVLCTDLDCEHGIEAAAVAWARTCDCAYGGTS